MGQPAAENSLPIWWPRRALIQAVVRVAFVIRTSACADIVCTQDANRKGSPSGDLGRRRSEVCSFCESYRTISHTINSVDVYLPIIRITFLSVLLSYSSPFTSSPFSDPHKDVFGQSHITISSMRTAETREGSTLLVQPRYLVWTLCRYIMCHGHGLGSCVRDLAAI